MQIHVPQDIQSSNLRIFTPGAYDIQLADIFYGTSNTGNPKQTFKYVVLSETEGVDDPDYISTVGENLLETFSLQPQALFRLNDVYNDVCKENLPMGDYTPEEFTAVVKSALVGTVFRAVLDVEPDNRGNERMVVRKRSVAD